MKKRILIGLSALVSLFFLWQFYVFFVTQKDSFQSIYLVPKDAIYILETQDPIGSWNEVSESDIWNHLQKNDYFNQLTTSLNKLDTIFKKNKSIINLTGKREVLISAHVYKPKKYSFLYVIDLEKIAKLNVLKNNIGRFFSDNYRISNRVYHTHKIVEVYDEKTKETLYISFLKNQMIVSYVHTLIEASIDQLEEPEIGRDLDYLEIQKNVSNSKLFKLYIQYKYINQYAKCFTDKSLDIIETIGDNLLFTGFDFKLDSKNTIIANGYTNVNETASAHMKALANNTSSKRSISKVLPAQTAVYTSLTFSDFTDFYQNFEAILKEDKTEYTKYLNGLEKVENYLKINVKQHFVSWIGNEIAFTHLNSPLNEIKNDFALVIKTNDIKKATTNLEFITNQIRKKTPVKFKSITYKEHTINYLAMKGFFNMFLGKLLNKIEKPYYTIIDDYVIFSNHPTTLKYIISSYIGENTLKNSKEFQDFNNYFDKKSSLFTYINTPLLYNSTMSVVNKKTQKEMQLNKDFIICFPQIGLQFNSDDTLLESKMVVKYVNPIIVKNNAFYSPNKKIIETTHSNTLPKIEDDKINVETIFNISEVYLSDLNARKYTSKHKNGTLKIEVFFKNGLKHGSYKEYYKNGELKISGKYRKGKQVGLWKAYDKKGKIITKKRM